MPSYGGELPNYIEFFFSFLKLIKFIEVGLLASCNCMEDGAARAHTVRQATGIGWSGQQAEHRVLFFLFFNTLFVSKYIITIQIYNNNIYFILKNYIF